MSNGRDPRGRFGEGNNFGQGRKKGSLNKRPIAYLDLLYESVPPEHFKAVMQRAVMDALGQKWGYEKLEGGKKDGETKRTLVDNPDSTEAGRNAARRFLAGYLIGKPTQHIILDEGGEDNSWWAEYFDMEPEDIAQVRRELEATIAAYKQLEEKDASDQSGTA